MKKEQKNLRRKRAAKSEFAGDFCFLFFSLPGRRGVGPYGVEDGPCMFRRYALFSRFFSASTGRKHSSSTAAAARKMPGVGTVLTWPSSM